MPRKADQTPSLPRPTGNTGTTTYTYKPAKKKK